MEKVEAEDIRAVLEDALESAEDENNVATLKRILDQLVEGALDPLPFSARQPSIVSAWSKNLRLSGRFRAPLGWTKLLEQGERT